MQNDDFDPVRAERLILSLRVENRRLQRRLHDERRSAGLDLPHSWQKKLAKIRTENGKYRTERNGARAELAALRAELEARSK